MTSDHSGSIVQSSAQAEAFARSSNWDPQRKRFVNALPERAPQIAPMLQKLMRGTDNARPHVDLPVQARRAADFEEAPEDGLQLTWLGHSTTLVEIDGTRVLLDPVWGERSSPFSWAGPQRFHAPPLPLSELLSLRVDAVAISHDHYDHLDQPTIEALRAHVPLFVVPLGVGAHLERWGVDRARIVERDWWQDVHVGTVRLVATPARHFSGRSLIMADRDRTLWSGWAIIGSEHRVYFSGDSAMFPGFAEIGRRLGPFDVTLLETGAYDELWADVHMGPEQAVLAHKLVRGKLYVPVHWGTFDLANHGWTEPVERAVAAAKRHGVKIALPRPGTTLKPDDTPAEPWWPALPWQDASESPVVSSGLPAWMLRELEVEAAPSAMQHRTRTPMAPGVLVPVPALAVR